MNNLKNILAIFSLCYLVISCGETKTEKQTENTVTQNHVEKKYTKVILLSEPLYIYELCAMVKDPAE